MGTWGTDIEDNDTYADVEAEFLEQLSQDKSPELLFKTFFAEEDFEEEISEETHDWWFAIADVFWKVGYLDVRVLNVVKKIIESKADIEYWKDCDTDEEDLQEREEVLKQFLNKISSPIEKPMVYDDFANERTEVLKTEPQEHIVYSKENITMAKQLWKDFYFKGYKKKSFFEKLFKIQNESIQQKPCFLAGTLIHTKNGLIPIEKIKIGDQVYCYDEISQKHTTQKVSKTFVNKTNKHLRVSTISGEEICVTGQHLFYQKGSKTWIKAHQLKIGMKLYLPLTDSFEEIENLKIIKRNTPTYNFEVPIHHNYLVGQTGILAHNASKFKTIDDLTTRKYQFYRLIIIDITDKIETQYIGKTTRDNLNIRNAEHNYQGKKKGAGSKHYWKFAEKPQIINLNNGNIALEFVEMTDIQSAVWEKYYLEQYRHTTGRKLRNIQNPMSKARFNALKKSGKHANVCVFFL